MPIDATGDTPDTPDTPDPATLFGPVAVPPPTPAIGSGLDELSAHVVPPAPDPGAGVDAETASQASQASQDLAEARAHLRRLVDKMGSPSATSGGTYLSLAERCSILSAIASGDKVDPTTRCQAIRILTLLRNDAPKGAETIDNRTILEFGEVEVSPLGKQTEARPAPARDDNRRHRPARPARPAPPEGHVPRPKSRMRPEARKGGRHPAPVHSPLAEGNASRVDLEMEERKGQGVGGLPLTPLQLDFLSGE